MSGEIETGTKGVQACVEVMDPGNLCGELEPWVAIRARMLLMGLAYIGYGRARVKETFRAQHESERLYGQGRTPGELVAASVPSELARPEEKKVSWIVPKWNRHGRRRALDVDLTMYVDLNDEAIEKTARSLGMTWGGVWSVRDRYHFEI